MFLMSSLLTVWELAPDIEPTGISAERKPYDIGLCSVPLLSGACPVVPPRGPVCVLSFLLPRQNLPLLVDKAFVVVIVDSGLI